MGGEDRMRISVALCTYNGEANLREQLDSIAAQTVRPDELFVCDDCSVDGTVGIVKEFARSALFPVRLLENAVNLGYGRNFNQAVQCCSYEMIALADQDDLWYPEKLATLRDILVADETLGGVFSNGELIDAASQPLKKTLWESFRFTGAEQARFKADQAVDVLLRRNVVTGMTLAIRSSMKPLLESVPAGWIHDAWLALQIAARSRLYAEPKRLVGYRVHGNQQVGVPITRAQQLQLMRQRGLFGLLDSVRKRHIGEYEKSAAQFEQLFKLLEAEGEERDESLIAKVEGKVSYSRRGATTLKLPRHLRWKALVSEFDMYRRFSPTGMRGYIRDFVV